MDETTARHHMERAIAEMWQSPSTSRIGVVLARDDGVLASAYKGQDGNHHAEAIALNTAGAAGIDLRGTTAFVTLEPCANPENSRTPCAQLLVDAGVAEVWIGRYDNNPGSIGRVGSCCDHGVGLRDFPPDLRAICEDGNSTFSGHFHKRVGARGRAKFDFQQNGGRYQLAVPFRCVSDDRVLKTDTPGALDPQRPLGRSMSAPSSLPPDLRSHLPADVLDRVERDLRVCLDRDALVRKLRSVGATTDRATWARTEVRTMARARGQGFDGLQAAGSLARVAKPAWHSSCAWDDPAHGWVWCADEIDLVTAPPIQPGSTHVVTTGSLGQVVGDAERLAERTVRCAETDRIATLHSVPMTRFVTSQSYYSLLGRDIEREILPVAMDQAVSLLVWSPLAGGILSGKYDRTGSSEAGARRSKESYPDVPPIDRSTAWDVVDVVRNIAERHEASIAQVALAWTLAQPGVTSVVVGAKRPEHITDNAAAAELELTADELDRLDAVSRGATPYPRWLWTSRAAIASRPDVPRRRALVPGQRSSAKPAPVDHLTRRFNRSASAARPRRASKRLSTRTACRRRIALLDHTDGNTTPTAMTSRRITKPADTNDPAVDRPNNAPFSNLRP